jgi:hypothetical protein
MKEDTELDGLTNEELFYLKDEWNEAYKKLAVEFDDLQKIHNKLLQEFSDRGIRFEVDHNTDEGDDGNFDHNNTIH